MDTSKQVLGNIPAVRNTFYVDTKPELKLAADQRASFLTFKTDKETKIKRDSMAVVVNLHTPSSIIHGCERGTEFLQALVNECQDSYVKLCADGKADFELVQDYQKMIADYFDTSRAGGQRVTAESVGKWFDATMSDWLMDRVVAKFPQFDADKVTKVVLQYRGAFADLAKYQMPHTKPVYQMIGKAFNEFYTALGEELVDQDMPTWIIERLAKLGNRHNADEMMIDAI